MPKAMLLFTAIASLFGRTTLDAPGGRDYQIFCHNINNVELCVSNYGTFGRSETGAGCWWPIGSGHNYIFGAGPWVGARDTVIGDTLVTIGYGPHGGESEFAPGLCGMPVTHPDAIIYVHPQPWPPPSAIFPMAPQEPVSHQDSWCCYNDCDPVYHIPGDTRPLGIEVYQSVYVWNLTLLCDVAYLVYTIRNKSGQNMRDFYFGICADNDIGNEAGALANDCFGYIRGQYYVIDGDSLWIDDLVYQWQEGEEPGTPPWVAGVIGYDLIQTPFDLVAGMDKDGDGILDQYERDSAYYVNNLPVDKWDVDRDGVPDWRDPSQIPQLGMTALQVFTLELEPNLDFERYLSLAGYNFRTMVYEPFPTVPIQDPGDIRYVQCSGPFELLADSTVTVALALVFANWEGIYMAPDTAVARVDHWAQYVFDRNWFVPGPPPAPGLTLVPGDAKVTLVWDNVPEQVGDSWFDLVGVDPTSPLYDPYYLQYDFEGYRVWKSLTGRAGSWELLASYDLANGIVFEDLDFQPEPLRATDAGVAHVFTDNDVRNGFLYYYAVTSFDYNMVKTVVGDSVFPTPVWFESGKTALSAVPRRDPANYLAPGEPVIEWLSGNQNIAELVSAAVAFPMAIDPAYPLYIEYLAQDTATLFSVDTLGNPVPYDGAQYTALLKDGHAILDTIRYAVKIGAGYIPHEIAPPRNGLLIRPDIGTPELPAGFAVFDTVEIVTGSYPAGFLVADIVAPLPQAADSADTLYDRGIWAWRGNDYEVVWRRKDPGGPVNTVEVRDLATGMAIPYATFQNNSATRHLGAGWCFTWHGSLGQVWTKQSRDTLQALGLTTERTRYLYIDGGVVGLRNNQYVLDTIRPVEGETWIIRANSAYLPASVYGSVRITATPAVLTETAATLNVKVVPNPYIIANEWQTRSVQRRVRFINLPNECTIRIFNLNGELVRTLKHRETSAGGVPNDLGGDEWWNVLNDFDQLVASGVYIFHVQSDVGEQVGKFVIVN
ncbi:T9SS type A sorting domain-containing protein [candidate division WOR-3 bacterium]|nr:T9SS type A sorting domain-containing protein [candidate division WOR-3 bacterium]